MHVLLAKAYYETGRTNGVERELQRAIELNPMQREPYVLLARLYVERNEHVQAIERLKRVIARDPKDVAALMLLGMIHNQLKNFTTEREMYEKVLAVNPRFSPALNNLAYLYSEHFKDLERAFQMAERARALLSRDPYTADTLGWILVDQDQTARGTELLQKAVETAPAATAIRYHWAAALAKSGDKARARKELADLLTRNKDFPQRQEAQALLRQL